MKKFIKHAILTIHDTEYASMVMRIDIDFALSLNIKDSIMFDNDSTNIIQPDWCYSISNNAFRCSSATIRGKTYCSESKELHLEAGNFNLRDENKFLLFSVAYQEEPNGSFVNNDIAGEFDHFPSYNEIYDYIGEVTGDLPDYVSRYNNTEHGMYIRNIFEFKNLQDYKSYLNI